MKRVGGLFGVMVLVSLGFASSAPSLWEPQGLKAHWTFAEGTGTAAGDSSGNANTGTLTNGAVWTTGRIGSALQLDGVNDYVALPANLNAARNASALTLSAWVNLATLPASGAFREIVSLSVNAGAPTNTSRLAMAVVGDGTAADVFVGARSTETEAQQTATATTADLATGTWYHLAAVYDIAGDTIKVYRNGSLLVTQAVNFSAASTPDTPSTNGALGAQDKGDSNFFRGALDEVKIFSRALSSAEVATLANGDALLAHWTFNEGSGLDAGDSSGNLYSGVLRNGPSWVGGQLGSAVDLDGTSQFIDLGTNLNLVRNVNAATVAAWILPTSITPNGAYAELVSISIASAGPTNTSRIALALRGDGISGGDLYAGGRSTDTETQKAVSADTNLPVGSWAHVAAVLDFSSKRITLYVNGSLVGSAAVDFAQTRTSNTASANAALACSIHTRR